MSLESLGRGAIPNRFFLLQFFDGSLESLGRGAIPNSTLSPEQKVRSLESLGRGAIPNLSAAGWRVRLKSELSPVFYIRPPHTPTRRMFGFTPLLLIKTVDERQNTIAYRNDLSLKSGTPTHEQRTHICPLPHHPAMTVGQKYESPHLPNNPLPSAQESPPNASHATPAKALDLAGQYPPEISPCLTDKRARRPERRSGSAGHLPT